MRNAEATRERILQAALAEFSAYGVAGARVDRIAKAAECNKNLIYIYFTNKETLFSTVLEKHLLRVYEELAFDAEDLPDFAKRMFDYAMVNPDLMRLIAWSSLEQQTSSSAARDALQAAKIAALTRAQTAGTLATRFPPTFLLTAVMTLATAWSAASAFGPTIDPEADQHPSALRDGIAAAVALLANAENS